VRIRDGVIESDQRRPPTAGIHRTRHELDRELVVSAGESRP
jgi:hypothetical protein